jgi:hypothetical protein
MSDMKQTVRSSGRAQPAASASDDRWRELVSAIGSEVAGPLTAALERIHTLITTGHIDRAGLSALSDEVASARQTAMNSQQLVRVASGRLRQSHERLPLADTLKSVLTHRAREVQARGIFLKPVLKPVDVIVDATLLFNLLNTTLDWAVVNARSRIAFTIDVKTWPPHARLMCRFAYRPADTLDGGAAADACAASLRSLTWRLLEQTAATMGLPLACTDEKGEISLTLEFPRTANDEMEGVSTIEMDDGFNASSTFNSKPLAGSHVLVVASRRDMRVQIRDAIRHMGLVIDLVSSVEEASDFCRSGLPHAIIVEGILAGERLSQLRNEISDEVPGFAFIEIVEEGDAFQMSGFDGASIARVGRGGLVSALPSVLMFELSKSL